MKRYKVHKSAKALHEYNIDNLVESIRKEGQLSPALIWFNGKEWLIVDGRHRQEACKRLGIELKVMKMSKDVEEIELPRKVLENQLQRRGVDKVYAGCEIIDFMDISVKKVSMKTLAEEYSNLVNSKTLSRIKKIKSIRPLWFSTLKMQEKVTVNSGGKMFKTNSINTLYSICINEEKMLNNKDDDNDDEEAKSQKLAIAYKEADSFIGLMSADVRRIVAEKLVGYPVAIAKDIK